MGSRYIDLSVFGTKIAIHMIIAKEADSSKSTHISEFSTIGECPIRVAQIVDRPWLIRGETVRPPPCPQMNIKIAKIGAALQQTKCVDSITSHLSEADLIHLQPAGLTIIGKKDFYSPHIGEFKLVVTIEYVKCLYK